MLAPQPLEWATPASRQGTPEASRWQAMPVVSPGERLLSSDSVPLDEAPSHLPHQRVAVRAAGGEEGLGHTEAHLRVVGEGAGRMIGTGDEGPREARVLEAEEAGDALGADFLLELTPGTELGRVAQGVSHGETDDGALDTRTGHPPTSGSSSTLLRRGYVRRTNSRKFHRAGAAAHWRTRGGSRW